LNLGSYGGLPINCTLLHLLFLLGGYSAEIGR
jgi:hypothetical protein